MFTIVPTIDKYGVEVRTTIDRERGLELICLKMSGDEAIFILKVGGTDILFYVRYRFVGDNDDIEYTVMIIGLDLSPRYRAYEFSSSQEKVRVAKYIEEALKVYGMRNSLSPGQSVIVKFSENSLSFQARENQGRSE